MTEAVVTEGTSGLLVNIRDIGDRWRGEDCAPRLVHTMPSRAMLTDALAQHLRAKGWERALLLRGPLPDDIAEAEAVRASAKKFGLEIVDEREFEVTNDPRRRDLSNIALLTGGVRYDVVWVADLRASSAATYPTPPRTPVPSLARRGSAHGPGTGPGSETARRSSTSASAAWRDGIWRRRTGRLGRGSRPSSRA